VLRVLSLSVAVVFMFPAEAANKAPKDFWLRLEFGCAGTDILDTAAGTYSRGWGVEKRQVADVWVSQKLKDQLFTHINEARFFELPASGIGLQICEPTTEYKLQVTSNGKAHRVKWGECGMPPPETDTIDPEASPAHRVVALGRAILRPFLAMGSVKQLRGRGGCI